MKLLCILPLLLAVKCIQLTGLEYPKSPQIEHIDNYHGIPVNDPYRWLEDSEDLLVQCWDKAQLAFYEKHQKDNHLISTVYAKIKEFNASAKTNSFSIGSHGKIFTIYQDPEQHAALYYVQENELAPLQLILDVNEWEGEYSVDYEIPSPNGELIAFGISKGGDEAPVLHLFNTTTLEELSDKVLGEKQENIVWTEDSSAFYYTTFPSPGDVPKEEEFLWNRVCFHTIATDSSEDFNVLDDPAHKDWFYSLMNEKGSLQIVRGRQLADSGEFLVEAYCLPLSEPHAPLQLTYQGRDSDDHYYQYLFRGETYYLTNAGAPNFRLVKYKFGILKDVISEREEILESVVQFNGKIAAIYREHGHNMILIFDFNGRLIKTVPLPSPGIVEFEPQENSPFANILFQSLTHPPSLYQYDERLNTLSLLVQTEISGYNPKDYSVKLEFVKSLDGVKIPLHVASRNNSKTSCALLTGYGGFQFKYPLLFRAEFIPWIQSKGVVGIAHLRGGSEYGEEWHRAGNRENKQNVFNDFIAAAELLNAKYAAPQKLAITGKSNGGLLTSAVMTQRPELFGAVVSSVPLTDMLRYPHHRMGNLWIGEYGSPEVKKQFLTLYNYSPYHHVAEGKAFPPSLITTALRDRRVDPLHSRKMAAMLQQRDSQGNPHLLSIDENSGHMYSSHLNYARRVAEEHGFLMQQLGIEIEVAKSLPISLEERKHHFFEKLKREQAFSEFKERMGSKAKLNELLEKAERKAKFQDRII